MTTRSITSMTDGQQKQFRRFIEDAADKALAETSLSKDELQRLIANGGKFQSSIMAAIREFSGTRFLREEILSDCTYPEEYKGPKPISEQVAILLERLPALGNATYDKKLATRPLPPNTEGWFAIPRWEKLGSSYTDAVERMFRSFWPTWNFNIHHRPIGRSHLRQLAETTRAFQRLGDEQFGHDILVVPAQFGLRHRGRSARRARETMNVDEFALGVFAVGCMLLTHPERQQLIKQKQLQVDCAGDEYAIDADQFFFAPSLAFNRKEAYLGVSEDSAVYNDFGVASGFLLL